MKRSRSLLWRLGALALAVTLVSLALHVLVIWLFLRPVGDGLLGQLAARAVTVRELVQSTPSVQRDALARRLHDPTFRLARGDPPVGGGTDSPLPLVHLAQVLGPSFEIRAGPASVWSSEQRFWLRFLVDGEPWHITVLAQPPIFAALGTGVGWLLLAAAAVGASLLIGLRFIVRPIREVAQRIAGQTTTIEPVPEPVGASSEVQSLVESFNRLVERIRAADRTKQHLLAGVSHDLRTPLARLRLRIETQCDGAVARAAEPELQAVEHIVSQFLAFVHGDSGAGLGPRQPALQVVERVVQSYAQHGVHIDLDADAADTHVGGLAVQRLLSNLIDNALAHGVPPVTVTWRRSRSGSHELAVWDHGKGLSDAQFQSALEPFVRLSKNAAIGHCGLGLAIVAQVAQQLDATLSCRKDVKGRFGVVVAWGQAPP